MSDLKISRTRLRNLCGPGEHDKPEYERNLPQFLQLLSVFSEETPDGQETRGSDEPPSSRGSSVPIISLNPSSQRRDRDSGEKTDAGPKRVTFNLREATAPRMRDSIEWHFIKWGFGYVKVAKYISCDSQNQETHVSPFPRPTGPVRTLCYLPAPVPYGERVPPPLPRATCGKPLPTPVCRGLRLASLPKERATKSNCVVRIYLGSVRGNGDANYFSCANSRMHLNQMIALRLDAESMARRVAVALALMHWASKTDAHGVVFALGTSWKEKTSLPQGPRRRKSWSGALPSPAQDRAQTGSAQVGELRTDLDREWIYPVSPPNAGPSLGARRRFIPCTTELFVMNFDQVGHITMDGQGVQKAVSAMRANGDCFPRPCQKLPMQKKTWNAFAASYIAASDVILQASSGERLLYLPRLLISRLVGAEKATLEEEEG